MSPEVSKFQIVRELRGDVHAAVVSQLRIPSRTPSQALPQGTPIPACIAISIPATGRIDLLRSPQPTASPALSTRQ
jgi:hypothetical protein